MNREALGLSNRLVGISAFSMTFGSENWDLDYIFNFWPIFLLFIPLLSIIVAMFKEKIFKIINVVVNIFGILFILIGYFHMVNLYGNDSGFIGEIWRIEFSPAGYIYIVLYIFVIVISLTCYLKEMKKK